MMVLKSRRADLKICSFIQVFIGYLRVLVCVVHWELVVGVIDRASPLRGLTSHGRDDQVISQINIK